MAQSAVQRRVSQPIYWDIPWMHWNCRYQNIKFKDTVKECHSWSGKKKINSYNFLSVVDHSGYFIFARFSLGNNDREVYTTSPLYLCEGDFF